VLNREKQQPFLFKNQPILMQTNLFLGGALTAMILTGSLVSTAPFGETTDRPTRLVAKATTYTVDPGQSYIRWNAKKVGGQHDGIVKLSKGEFTVDGSKLTGGTFTADMTSLRDVDKGEENAYNERLVNHLRSDDFFGVEKNPSSTFKITSVKPIAGAKAGEPNYTVSGDLTIKGITKPQTFPATVKLAGNTVEATANFPINRIDYDIKYRAALIGTAADKIIDDAFTLNLKMVANKASM
jgi:polyisoprenoid-binding protein YceI